jgi:type III pantothenate kinase
MLLTVDIGNSNIKFGVYDGITLLSRSVVPTRTAFSPETLISAIGSSLDLPIDRSIVCSVVPDADRQIAALLLDITGKDPRFVTNDFDFGFEINYRPLTSLGTDRIVNCFAAVEKYGAPAIVCSFGTASTFDVISRARVLLGGLIAPGMKAMASALRSETSKLPEAAIEKPRGILGDTTSTAISSGIFYGHLALVEGVIEKITTEMGERYPVIVTGGWAGTIAENTTVIDEVDETLLSDGLCLLDGRLS